MSTTHLPVLVCRAPDDVHDSSYVEFVLREELRAAGIEDIAVIGGYDPAALERAPFLLSYIAERSPDEAECEAVLRFLERGGRWFAIHTSNWVDASCRLPAAIGSRFITHPPYGPFRVDVARPKDPLVAGIEPFEVEDELYIVEQAGGLEVLLSARWGGISGGLSFETADQPMLYRRSAGAGEVVYLALGHCNAAGTANERLGSWATPVFREIVGRGVRWAAGL